MKFGNEFWLILIREYIIPNLFAVQQTTWPVTTKLKIEGKKLAVVSATGGGKAPCITAIYCVASVAGTP
jgi:hypothetical protein